MRHVICALSILCGLSPAMQAADVTVVLDFEARHSERAAAVMELEAERLLADFGFSLEWRMLNRLAQGESFSRLAVVKLRGRCEMAPFLPASSEPPARLGLTYSVDGRVIPFSEVKCDEVRAALSLAHLTANPEVREVLFGRALGRVMAHELLHVLNRSDRHTKEGVTQKYLSAAKLTGDAID
jgi:hypothetical protein